ncbi:MAG TPA: VOC family protein [Thermoanaerobaculia bacterium]|nr:VOC family protein [Thermoanaerobaculia bacterium]
MPQFTAYLSFDGTCADAMRFYEKALGGRLEALLTNGQTPAAGELPPGNEDRIMHAYLVFDGGVLMAGDSVVGWPHEKMQGFNLTISYEKTDDAKRVFESLSDGGQVKMEWQKTFWAEGFGMLTDRFGTPWIVNGASMNLQMEGN